MQTRGDPGHISKSSQYDERLGAPGAPQVGTTKISSFWRPAFLSKRALTAFSIAFLALALGIQILHVLSKRNTGLSGVNDGPHRIVWTYGPAAVLTLVASFWTRLEFQTKTTAPWIKMTQDFTKVQQSLILDYLSQFQPFSIVSAIKNKDHTVAAITFGSLLIKVLLILSTSLCSPSPTETVRLNMPLTLKSEFINSPSGLMGNGSLACASLASIMKFSTPLPRGTSHKYAYQLVESDFLDTPSAISTTLDGFFGDLECEPAALPASSVPLNLSYGNSIPIHSASCSFNISLFIAPSSLNNDGDHVIGLQPGGCDGSSDIDDKRLAFIIAVMARPSLRGDSELTILKSNSFICKPTYRIERLDFSAQGSERSVLSSKTADSRVLSNVHAWDIMQSHLDTVLWMVTIMENTANISNQTVYFDRYAFLAYLLANNSGNPPALSTLFEDLDGARTFISNYYQQYTALLAHTSLMAPVSIPSEATVIEVGDRYLGECCVNLVVDSKFHANKFSSERHRCQLDDRYRGVVHHLGWHHLVL